MPANFLSLPSELRNNIYEQLLVLQEPVVSLIQGWRWQSQARALTPGLLRANKTVHLEASSMLYGQNRFDFTMCTPEAVTSFLEQIGRNNASYIKHICIDFPKFQCVGLHDHDNALEDDSERILATIQSECTNLRTLETSVHNTLDTEIKLDSLGYREPVPKELALVSKELTLVDARFRAISSLQEIIALVEVYEVGPNYHTREEMKNLGWTISERKYLEESDHSEDWDHYDWSMDDRYDGDIERSLHTESYASIYE